MTTTVVLRGERVRLQDQDLLGVGGEARVFRRGQEALKLFHEVPAGLSPKEQKALASMGALRARKIQQFPGGLPTAVVAPIAPLHDEKTHRLVGYAMPLVEGATELLRLSQRKWRQGVMPTSDVIELFRRLHRVVDALHAAGVVVGDLNDGNVLARGTAPYLIDADSMQFAGLPCVVGHERTLDPLLYGEDLTKGLRFSTSSDWYAYSVLLFSSLLYVHPYGGVQPALPTLLRRAEAAHSVLQDDVRLPRHAVPPSVLTDDLLHWFAQVFDEKRRAAFPAPLLDVQFSPCLDCGLEHARARCPVCATQVSVAPTPSVVVRGSCRETVVLQTRGTVVAAVLQGKLRWLVEERGAVRREDGTLVLEEARRPDLEMALAGGRTWLARRGRLVAIEQGEVVDRASSGVTPAGHTTFAATGHGLLRTEGDVLVHHESGRHLGRILDGQTRLFGAGPLVFGCYQAGEIFFGFVVDPAGGALRDLPPLGVRGRVIDVEAHSDGERLLVAIAAELNGQRTHHLHLFDHRGQLLGRLVGGPDDHPALSTLGGKAVRGGRVLAASPEGLILLEPARDPGSAAPRLVTTRSFPDASVFVSGDVDLIPGPSGTVYVVTPRAITQLSLSAP